MAAPLPMKRLESNVKALIQYGISSDLAERAAKTGLTVTKARTLSQQDIVEKFSFSREEAAELKSAVSRQPIDEDTLITLLENSNYVCNICHGEKGLSFIVHHIEAYSKTQDNSYGNLIVLCPNDHDLAHGSGLSMSISVEMLRRSKNKWEATVEKVNTARAAQAIEVDESAIDYINILRIEELCLRIFGEIPETRATTALKSKGIIDAHGNFQKKYVQTQLSCGRYLFDYINSGEALHYHDLMVEIAEKIKFEDLSTAIDTGRKAVASLEGSYAFFIGGVYSKRPELPIDERTPEVLMHYTKRKIRVEWNLDPSFFFSMSAISRQGTKNRYIIYCLVRTVDCDSLPGHVLVKASPLFIAQPSKHTNRIPVIGWMHRYPEHDDDDHDEVHLDRLEDEVK